MGDNPIPRAVNWAGILRPFGAYLSAIPSRNSPRGGVEDRMRERGNSPISKAPQDDREKKRPENRQTDCGSGAHSDIRDGFFGNRHSVAYPGQNSRENRSAQIPGRSFGKPSQKSGNGGPAKEDRSEGSGPFP